jgi:cysteinyl-tRNA synthetase
MEDVETDIDSCSVLYLLVSFVLLYATDLFLFIFGFILQIISNCCAYTVDGDVYFSIDNFPNYGRLSKLNLDGNRAGERVAVDSRKRNPADFALWKVNIW